jgi:phage baseplate assembly protein W
MINISTLKNSDIGNGYVFSDLNLSFEEKQISGNKRNSDIAPGNDLVIDYDINAIKNSIQNILFQSRYTSDLNVNLKSHIGEPISELRATSIGEEIERAIITYDDRIKIQKIYIYTNYDQNSYNIAMVLNVPNFKQPQITIYANFDNNGIFQFINS